MAPSTIQDITSGSECIPGPRAIHSDPSVYILYSPKEPWVNIYLRNNDYNVNKVVARWSQGSHNVVT